MSETRLFNSTFAHLGRYAKGMSYLISEGHLDFLQGLPSGLLITWGIAIVVAIVVLRFVLRLVKKIVGVILVFGAIAVLGGGGLGLVTGFFG